MTLDEIQKNAKDAWIKACDAQAAKDQALLAARAAQADADAAIRAASDADDAAKQAYDLLRNYQG
jgi:hypothetical protein